MNCKEGILRERKLSENREPVCGRCEIPLENPEENFCRICKRLEFEEYPIQFIDYFDNSHEGESHSKHRKMEVCPRGHRMEGENLKITDGRRKCKACESTKYMIRRKVIQNAERSMRMRKNRKIS